jgi:hypothetical protein
MARGGFVLAVLVCAGGPVGAVEPGEGSSVFFDAVVSTTPGMSREVGILFEQFRAPDGTLTQPSLKLQYPLLSWFQVALQVPVIISDPKGGATSVDMGDVLLTAQAAAWIPRGWPAEIDVGLELPLPSGGGERALAGNTATRPFVAAATKLGPIDVLGNLSYQWIVDGPAAGTDLFQASFAVGYPFRSVVPFAELTVSKPVRGQGDLGHQFAVVPGIEIYLPWHMSLSVGVQFSLGPQHFFDQRVLGFFKWPF